MLIGPGRKLLFIGDSITDCGRARGDGTGEALGRGYVSLVDALLVAGDPAGQRRVVNRGIGGNTVRDLKGRWEQDVLAERPDWLSIMIGINDVWRQFDNPGRPDIHVLPEEFERTLDDLLTRTRPTLPGGLVLMSPFFIEPNRADPMRARMDAYGAIVRALAGKHGTIYVDTQAAFDGVLVYLRSAALAGDRVHPGVAGHMVLAQAFLHAIGSV